MATPPPRSRLYQRATIIFQAQQAPDGGWLPRCTIVYGLKGQMTEHVIKDETPRATEQTADDTIFAIAKRWIEEHDDQMTSFRWGTKIDDESKALWRELHDPDAK
jgi:hypothetical protein